MLNILIKIMEMLLEHKIQSVSVYSNVQTIENNKSLGILGWHFEIHWSTVRGLSQSIKFLLHFYFVVLEANIRFVIWVIHIFFFISHMSVWSLAAAVENNMCEKLYSTFSLVINFSSAELNRNSQELYVNYLHGSIWAQNLLRMKKALLD